MKKKAIIALLTAALTLTLVGTAYTTTGEKLIEATYRGIVIMVNGNTLTPEPGMGEPFIVTSEGRTYVPIRMAAEALGLNVEWVDWLNAVQITGSTSSSELEALKAENTRLKADLQAYKDKEKGMNLGDLEDDLFYDYGKLKDVKIKDIILDGDKDDVGVQIKVDLYDYAAKWKKLTDSDIQYWLEDLVDDIQYELSKSAYVSGKITDIDSGDVLVKFSKDGSSKLKTTFYDDRYRTGGQTADDVIKGIKGDGYDVGGIDFTVSDISYDKDAKEASVTLKADYNASSSWAGLDYRYDIKPDLTDVCEDIADIFADEGFSLKTMLIDIRNNNNSRLDSYDYDVDRGRLL